MTFADYLDEHPEKRAAIEMQLDLYDQQRRDPYGHVADADGCLSIRARRHQGTGTWRDLPEPVVIHKADVDWLTGLWAAEDFFELELWQAGIGLEAMEGAR